MITPEIIYVDITDSIEPIFIDIISGYKADIIPARFKIGDGGLNTPLAGTRSFTLASLIGKSVSDFGLWRNGTILYPGDEYTFDPALGKVTLAVTQDIFTNGETFFIK